MSTPGRKTTRNVRTVLVDAERRLAGAGVPSPRVDAELLLAHLLEVPRNRLILTDEVDRSLLVRYEVLLARRAARQPLQHLIGAAPFRHLELAVGPGVFVPRPETEVVVEGALRELRAGPGRLVVDLCAGTGAVGLAIATEVPGTTVHLVERESAAASWLARNVRAQAEALERAGSVAYVHEDDAGAVHERSLAELAGTVDLVVCNPPYIPDEATPRDPEVREYDPAVALYGGPDGLDVVRRVAVAAAALLRPGGAFVVEHGDAQGEAAGDLGVPAVLRQTPGFGTVVDRVDLAGRDRYSITHRADEAEQ